MVKRPPPSQTPLHEQTYIDIHVYVHNMCVFLFVHTHMWMFAFRVTETVSQFQNKECKRLLAMVMLERSGVLCLARVCTEVDLLFTAMSTRTHFIARKH